MGKELRVYRDYYVYLYVLRERGTVPSINQLNVEIQKTLMLGKGGGICTSERRATKTRDKLLQRRIRDNTRKNKKDMKGIYHPSLDDRVREGGREKKRKIPKKEKAKKRDCPDFSRCDAEWSGKNAHSFRF